jgi:RNA polymerase sigma factor (sigma-70 family)
MLDVAARTPVGEADEAVKALLLARLPSAQRLATCILRDPMAAEDAAQEAALIAWDHRRDLRDPGAVEAWFNRIVINVCKHELRRRSRKPIVAEITPGWERDRDLAERDALGRAIQRLSPNEQLVLALRYARDLTIPQIAELTGIREGTVKSQLHSARNNLRGILDADKRLEELQR